MAATLAGAFKHYLERDVHLGVPVYRDGAPVRMIDGKERIAVDPPYVVIQDGIGMVRDKHGDMASPDASPSSKEQVQIDLFQVARVRVSPTSTRTTEDPALLLTLSRALNGVGIQPYAPTLVYGHTVMSSQRWPIADNIARTTWTVEVARSDEPLPTGV